MRIVFTREAIGDIRSIYNYYKVRASLKIADKILQQILHGTEQLKEMPYSGSIEEIARSLNQYHHRIVSGNFKIVYHVIKNDVVIDTIFDARQDPVKLLMKLRGETGE